MSSYFVRKIDELGREISEIETKLSQIELSNRTLSQGLTEIVNCESVYGERASKHAREVLSDAGIKAERKPIMIVCEKCEAEENSGYRHACPFRQEIHGDNNPEFCYCCEDCTRECRMSI